MRYVAIVLLWLAASLGHAAQVGFAWDSQPEYPPGVTYELIANECSLSGITATTATCALAGAPGSPLHAQVRAISPDAEQWSDSAWSSIDDVIPGAVVLYTTPGEQTQLNVIRAGGGSVMAAPTYQTTTQSNSPADFASANTSTTRTTPSYSPTAGTILVGCAVSENTDAKPVSSISGGPTWTQQYLDNTDSKASVALYTATAAGGAITSTVTSGGAYSGKMGLAVLQFTGSDGIGAKNTAKGTTGFPSVSLTTTQANSAVVMVVGDWAAITGTSTFSTVNSTPVEIVDYADGASYGVHIAYWPDVGAAGAKTFAMSAPSGQNWTAHVIEIKGTAGGGSTASGDGRSQGSAIAAGAGASTNAKAPALVGYAVSNAAGAATNARVAAAIARASAAASGASTHSAVGQSVAYGQAIGNGGSLFSGYGVSIGRSFGTASGVSTAAGAGSSLWRADARASGASTAAVVGSTWGYGFAAGDYSSSNLQVGAGASVSYGQARAGGASTHAQQGSGIGAATAAASGAATSAQTGASRGYGGASGSMASIFARSGSGYGYGIGAGSFATTNAQTGIGVSHGGGQARATGASTAAQSGAALAGTTSTGAGAATSAQSGYSWGYGVAAGRFGGFSAYREADIVKTDDRAISIAYVERRRDGIYINSTQDVVH